MVLEEYLPQQYQCQFPTTTTLLAVLPLLISIFLLVGAARRRRSSSRHHLPPRPSGLPILGNLHQMGALPHRSLRELARRNGPVMLLRLGTVPTVVVSSADAARDMLKTHDADCCSWPDTPGPRRLSYEHKDVAFSPYSDFWRERRKLMVVEFLSKRRIQANRYAREAEVGKLVSGLALASIGRKPVLLEDHVFGYLDSIVGTVAFGNIYGTEHLAPYREHFHHVIDEAMVVRSSFSAEECFPNALGRFVDRLTGVTSLRDRVFEEYNAFFEMMIEKHLDRRDKPDNGYGLIDVLIGLMKEEHHEGSFRFDRDVIKALLMNTFIGVVDTGAMTIIWAMAELVRNSHVLNKVQDEIRTVVGSKKERVQRDDVAKLKYLKMVVMETLRLHPALLLLVPRETARHITVSNYDVPAKTRILVNAWAIERHPANWDNPEEFIPERFDGEDVNFNRAQFEYLPFGAGRRMCLGIDMEVATTKFTLANLLYCFDWELPEGLRSEYMCMEEAGGLTIHKKTPLLLVSTRYHTSG